MFTDETLLGLDETLSVAYSSGETRTFFQTFFLLFGRDRVWRNPASVWQGEGNFEVLKSCYIQLVFFCVMETLFICNICEIGVMWSSCKRSSETQLSHWYKAGQTSTLSYFTQTGAVYEKKYLSKIPADINVLSCEQKYSKIWGIADAIFPRYICKIPRSMYTRVSHAMVQFILKRAKLSHIISAALCLQSLSPIMAPGRVVYELKHGFYVWH